MAADTSPTTALFEALRAADAERVQAILDAQPELIASPNADGLSPLTMALYMHQPPIVELLLARLPESSLSIHEASAAGRAGRVQDLLASAPESANAWSPDGFQPLQLAAFFGHPALVELLLAHGADVNSVARHPFGVAALHAALASPRPETARMLVAAGANVNLAQSGGNTPLHETAHIGSVELTRFLLEHGALRQASDDHGRTPEAIAREHGHTEVAALLAT